MDLLNLRLYSVTISERLEPSLYTVSTQTNRPMCHKQNSYYKKFT